MNNQREIYEALLDGETLISLDGDKRRLNDAGILINATTGEDYSWISGHPSNWQIYTKTEWYENIPDGGVLCWCCKNVDSSQYLRIVIKKDKGTSFWDNNRTAWGFAKPLTKQEIQKYLDNAPEAI